MNTRAAFVKHLFQGLRWYEASEYALLMLFIVSISIQWHIALWCLILLCANTLIKIIVTRHIGNPALNRPTRVCLGLMMLFYIVYAISGTYSSQPDEALSTASMMLPLLLFPLLFILGDTRYLHPRRISALAYLLAATLTLRFIFMLIRSAFHTADSQLFTCTTSTFATLLVQAVSLLTQQTPFPQFDYPIFLIPIRAVAHLFNDTPIEHIKPFQFDPLHHNYLSLYILTAISLLYTSLVHHWQSPRWHRARWFVLVDILLLSLYILLSGSRSGIVAWVFLATACLLHLAFSKKQWRTLGIIIAATVLIIGISYWALPKPYKHITDTAKNLLRGEQGDVRQTLWQSGLATFKERPLFGYGCDGYWDALFEQYRTHDCLHATIQQFSTHNQYLETTLSTGIVGLAVMLAMIAMPVVLALRRPHRNLPMLLFTVVYATCIFFEATFGRQMGLLFISFWYCLILLYSLSPNSHPSNT